MTKQVLTQILLTFLFLLGGFKMSAENIKGTVIDKTTKEPLIGAAIQIQGSNSGTVTDFDGNFQFTSLNQGTYTLIISYVAYIPETVTVQSGNTDNLLIELTQDNQNLAEVTVVARKKLEGEKALQLERQNSVLSIENIGSKEMSLKGISNVEEGVKKMTGISVASAGQIIVRGLGDRYSSTTLNGLPIASPNPDNKLIPLNIFPTSTIKNITVSKVYDAKTFADYSGAHIDISTREQNGEDFFTMSFGMSGAANTIGRDFMQMDRNGTLLSNNNMDKSIINMPLAEFEQYVKQNNIFNTTFEVNKYKALPALSGNIGWGKNFEINGHKLNVLAAIGMSNDYQTINNAMIKTLETGGNTLNQFTYDEYSNEAKITALGNLGYSLRARDYIGYTFFYARNANCSYLDREGFDYDGHQLKGSNSITHIYTLQNHQLTGNHYFGENWKLKWAGSYSATGSYEPDRRQVMFEKKDDGLTLFKLNRQETMRYFGTLNENEAVGNIAMTYNYGEKNALDFGFDYKNKSRDYNATRFYYVLSKLNPENIKDIYHTDGYLNQDNIENGLISIDRKNEPKDSYKAGNIIYAGYVATNYYPTASLLVNIGVRYEKSKQWVNYFTDGGKAMRNDLDQDDLFPALNLKYEIGTENNVRFSFSRTVTRPSFIEMAPFAYQESYGSAKVRGNKDLKNGYNYNLDLRYELFKNGGDMISLTGYYKHLNSPIERVQTLEGGATIYTFRNAEDGLAAGLEVEARKEIIKDLRIGANASYMYTNIVLPDGGAYTNTQRMLQGASPYLVNADITYTPSFGEESMLNMALVYNLQGPRIHSVGIAGLGDVIQQPVHTLNLTIGYKLNSHWNFKLQANDLLNREIRFVQEIPVTGEEETVECYKTGTNFEIGFSYTL